MKKLISFILAGFMMAGVVGCEDGNAKTTQNDDLTQEIQHPSSSDVEYEFLHNGIFRINVDSIDTTEDGYDLTISFVGEEERQADPNICASDIDRLLGTILEGNQSVYDSLENVIFNCPSDGKNYQASLSIQSYQSGHDISFLETIGGSSDVIVVTAADIEATLAEAQQELDELLEHPKELTIGRTLYDDDKISIVYKGTTEYEIIHAPDNLDVPKAAIIFSVINKTGKSLTLTFSDFRVNGINSGYVTSHSISSNENNSVEVRFDDLPKLLENIHSSGSIMFDDYSTFDLKF